MKLEVLFSPEEIENEYDLRERTVAVIDVLRSTSSIVTAIHHGARQVIPVASVADAMRLSKDLFDDSTILCGERGGRLIDGFDIDNSPASYRPERVKDKSLLFTSTNGATAILRSKYARETLIAGFVNISAVANALRDCENVVVLCSGNQSHFSFEDALCAGMIIERLSATGTAELSDGARWAKIVYERCSDGILAAVRSSDHAKVLDGEGFGADVTFCATSDVYTEVPRFDGVVIRPEKSSRGKIKL